MAAAAPNLTPLTLELGGKSPAIVAADFPIEQAAARLATGKWLNSGQTCIAPDYVLVDHARRDALVAALCEQARARYGDLKQADDFTRRSEEHTSELQSLMRISYAVFCLKKKKHTSRYQNIN